MASNDPNWWRETPRGGIGDIRWWESNFGQLLEDQDQLTLAQYAEIAAYEFLALEGQESRFEDENEAQSRQNESGQPVKPDYCPTRICSLHPVAIATRKLIAERQGPSRYSNEEFSKVDTPQIDYQDIVKSIGQKIQGHANVHQETSLPGKLYDLKMLIAMSRSVEICVPKIVERAARCKLMPPDRLAAYVIEELTRKKRRLPGAQALYTSFLNMGPISIDGPTQISFRLKDDQELASIVGQQRGRNAFIVWSDALGNKGEFSLHDLVNKHISNYIRL